MLDDQTANLKQKYSSPSNPGYRSKTQISGGYNSNYYGLWIFIFSSFCENTTNKSLLIHKVEIHFFYFYLLGFFSALIYSFSFFWLFMILLMVWLLVFHLINLIFRFLKLTYLFFLFLTMSTRYFIIVWVLIY